MPKTFLSNQNNTDLKKRKSEIQKRYYYRHKEKIKVKAKNYRQTPEFKEWHRKWENKWRRKNPEKVKERRRKYKDKYPDKERSSKMKAEYGITIEEYNQMFVNQNGLCAICGEKDIRGTFLCIDHNHINGKIRGLLCSKCNSGLGFFNDSENIILKALSYLKEYDK